MRQHFTKTDEYYYVEANVEDAVVDYALSKGYFRRKIQWIGRRSAPDNIFSKMGVTPFFVEFKKPGRYKKKDKADPAQDREIKRMRNAGLIVHVISNIEDGYALFD